MFGERGGGESRVDRIRSSLGEGRTFSVEFVCWEIPEVTGFLLRVGHPLSSIDLKE